VTTEPRININDVVSVRDLPAKPAGVADWLIGVPSNQGGPPFRAPFEQLPVQPAVQQQIDALAAGQQAGQLVYRTWAELSAVTGSVGEGAQVLDDAGTHTDPVVGGTVANAGQYVWSESPAGWRWVRPDALPLKADKSELAGKADASLIAPATPDADVAAAVVFADRSRTWLEADSRGRPTPHAQTLIGEAVGISPSPDIEGVAAAIFYPDTDEVLFAVASDGTPLIYNGTPYRSSWPAVAYGDSTTYGADLANPEVDRWTTRLAAMVGRPIINMGISGARAEEIQARFGAIDAALETPAGTIPASGSVVLTAVDINPVRLGGPLPVELLCEGGERVTGTLSYASATTAVFARAVSGSSIATKRVRVMSRLGDQHRHLLMFIGQGINNESMIGSGQQTVSQIKSWYRSATEHLSPAKTRLVVWGLLDRGASEAAGTTNGDFIREIERWLAEQYGNSYAPVRQFLASEYAFDIALRYDGGFTPTSADDAAVAAGTIPPCFRVNPGSVHLNPLGHKLQAWFLHQHLIARGLV